MRSATKPLQLFLLAVVCFLAMESQAALTARLERDRIAEGETVQLLVEALGQVSGSPDTQPLEQDFELLGITSGSRVNIANGRIDSRTNWTLSLSPKRTGILRIPPLELDGERTPALTLEVTEVPLSDSPDSGSPIFIETEVDQTAPYVQAMVRYTVRLFHGVRLSEGRLSEPHPDNALVRRLGEDREYTQERGGRRYRVIERQYAVFPQASGELVLPGPVLDARIPEQRKSARGSPFDEFLGGNSPFDGSFFGRDPFSELRRATRPVRVRGEALSLNVRSRPERLDSGYWLPVEGLDLTEDWQPDQGPFHVGDPITRTVSISAEGVSGEQLPDIDPGPVDGFKVYPDRAQVETRDLPRGVVGEKRRSIAFVPTRPGSFTLPPVRLHWWDTGNDQQQLTELPARHIEVLPAADGKPLQELQSKAAETESNNSQGLTADRQRPVDAQQPMGETINAGAEVGLLQSDRWLWISALFALLWLTTLVLWWQAHNRRPEPVAQTGKPDRPDVRAAQRRFQSACRSGNPQPARRALLEWAGAHWPEDPPAGLDDLIARLDDPSARRALAELDRRLYRQEEGDWDGTSLAKAIPRLPQIGTRRQVKGPLPELYR